MAGPAIRSVAAGDKDTWFRLWQGYLEFYETVLDPAISESTWRRLLDSNEPIHGLVACDSAGTAIGLVNYVLHANTWTDRPVCYLEDLFVTPDSRGAGAGRALIEAVIDRAKTQGWYRVYWQTKQNNATAQRLYDQIAQRTDWLRYDVMLGQD
jgi:GNAT superfamily N-acetyltransferase